MANPLKSLIGGNMGGMMGGSNPLLQAMMGGNPQQALMGMLQQQNPQAFQQFQQMKNSGQNPSALMQQMMGNMNPQQKQQVQQMMNQIKR